MHMMEGDGLLQTDGKKYGYRMADEKIVNVLLEQLKKYAEKGYQHYFNFDESLLQSYKGKRLHVIPIDCQCHEKRLKQVEEENRELQKDVGFLKQTAKSRESSLPVQLQVNTNAVAEKTEMGDWNAKFVEMDIKFNNVQKKALNLQKILDETNNKIGELEKKLTEQGNEFKEKLDEKDGKIATLEENLGKANSKIEELEKPKIVPEQSNISLNSSVPEQQQVSSAAIYKTVFDKGDTSVVKNFVGQEAGIQPAIIQKSLNPDSSS